MKRRQGWANCKKLSMVTLTFKIRWYSIIILFFRIYRKWFWNYLRQIKEIFEKCCLVNREEFLYLWIHLFKDWRNTTQHTTEICSKDSYKKNSCLGAIPASILVVLNWPQWEVLVCSKYLTVVEYFLIPHLKTILLSLRSNYGPIPILSVLGNVIEKLLGTLSSVTWRGTN